MHPLYLRLFLRLLYYTHQRLLHAIHYSFRNFTNCFSFIFFIGWKMSHHRCGRIKQFLVAYKALAAFLKSFLGNNTLGVEDHMV